MFNILYIIVGQMNYNVKNEATCYEICSMYDDSSYKFHNDSCMIRTLTWFWIHLGYTACPDSY